jgi:hypothetical protein
MTRADVAEPVQDAEVGKDAAAGNDILDQTGIDTWNRDGRCLGAGLPETEQQRNRYHRAQARAPNPHPCPDRLT